MEGVLNWLVDAIPLGIMALGAGMAMAIPFMPRDSASQEDAGREDASREDASRASAATEDGEALGVRPGDGTAARRLLGDDPLDDLLDDKGNERRDEEEEALPSVRVILLWDAMSGAYQEARPRGNGAMRAGAPQRLAPSAFVSAPTRELLNAMMRDDWRRMWRRHAWVTRRKALTDGVMYTQRFHLMVADVLRWPATN